MIKKYDKSRQCPLSNDLIQNHELYLQKQYVRITRDFSPCVDKAFDWANKELISIIVNEKQLIKRLRSIKQYFFLECGDLFVHFMEAAESELDKDLRLASQEKLQSLLDLSMRTSSADRDDFADDVSCYLSLHSHQSIMNAFWGYSEKEKQIIELDHMLVAYSPTEAGLKDMKETKSFDHLTLEYSVEWPLNLILSPENLIYYKLIFRHLFSLRHVESKLYKCWASNQSLKADKISPGAKCFFLLLQRMISLIRNILYNFCCEVIEENWKTLVENVSQVAFGDAEGQEVRRHPRLPQRLRAELRERHADHRPELLEAAHEARQKLHRADLCLGEAGRPHAADEGSRGSPDGQARGRLRQREDGRRAADVPQLEDAAVHQHREQSLEHVRQVRDEPAGLHEERVAAGHQTPQVRAVLHQPLPADQLQRLLHQVGRYGRL